MPKLDATAFQEALKYSHKKDLINDWPYVDFYIVLGKEGNGETLPVISSHDTANFIGITLNKAEAEKWVKDFKGLSPDVHLFVDAIPLWEIARSAWRNHEVLLWPEEQLLISGDNLLKLSVSTTVTAENGESVTYSVDALPLVDGFGRPLQRSPLQRWVRGAHLEPDSVQFVVDDEWLEGLGRSALKLPSETRLLGDLPEPERSVFETRAQPKAPFLVLGEKALDIPADNLLSVPGLPEEYLSGFLAAHECLTKKYFCDSTKLKIRVEPCESGDQTAGSEAPMFKYSYLFLLRTPDLRYVELVFATDLIPQEKISNSPFALPVSTGLHQMPSFLASLLRRHLAWELFLKSRFVSDLFETVFQPIEGLLYFRPEDAQTDFFADVSGNEFPYCGYLRGEFSDRVPVMVLGKQGGKLICRVLSTFEFGDTEPEPRVIRVAEESVEFPGDFYLGPRLPAFYVLESVAGDLISNGLVLRRKRRQVA